MFPGVSIPLIVIILIMLILIIIIINSVGIQRIFCFIGSLVLIIVSFASTVFFASAAFWVAFRVFIVVHAVAGVPCVFSAVISVFLAHKNGWESDVVWPLLKFKCLRFKLIYFLLRISETKFKQFFGILDILNYVVLDSRIFKFLNFEFYL